MTDPSPDGKDDRFGSFDARLRAAQARRADKERPKGGPGKSTSSGIGYAMRLGSEMVAAVIVGGGIGFGLDYLLGSKPWLALVGVIFGFVAGTINVVRVSMGYGSGVGWKKPGENGSKGE